MRSFAFFVSIVVFAAMSGSAAAQQLPYPAQAHDSGAALSAAQNNVPAAARRAEDDVERGVRRFGIGVDGGVALDPELIDVGVHGTFGPVFTPAVQFRPGVELAFGEVTTLFGINLDVLYRLPGTSAGMRWRPYVGAGPNFSLSHRGFTSPTTSTTSGRFDFSDTSFESGLNLIAGVRNRNGLFLEMKATAYGVSNVRLMAGFNF